MAFSVGKFMIMNWMLGESYIFSQTQFTWKKISPFSGKGCMTAFHLDDMNHQCPCFLWFVVFGICWKDVFHLINPVPSKYVQIYYLSMIPKHEHD